jgi:hypothetical protein
MSKRAVNLLRQGMTPAMDLSPQTMTVAGATALNGEVTISGPNTNGVVGVILGASTSLIGAGGNYDAAAMVQPANTTLLEVGAFYAVATDDATSGNKQISFGLSAGAAEIVALTTVAASTNTIHLNSAISTGGMKADAGNSLAFVADYAHHVTADTDIHCRQTTVGGGAGNTTGTFRPYIKFIYM